MDVPHADQRNMDYQNQEIFMITVFSFYDVKNVKKFGHLKLLALVKMLALD